MYLHYSTRNSFFLCVLLTLLFGSVYSYGQTLILTDIERDTRWNKASSPYIIQKNIRVLSEAMLEIEAGVEVLFERDTRLHVDGRLTAIGTKRRPIVFKGLRHRDWDGIYFSRKSTAYNAKTEEGNQLVYCNIEGTKQRPKRAVEIEGTTVLIRNSQFKDCFTAVYTDRIARLTAEKSTFIHCNRAFNIRNSSLAHIAYNEIKNCNSIFINAPTQFINNTLCKFTDVGTQAGLIIWLNSGGEVRIQGNRFEYAKGAALTLKRLSRSSRVHILYNDFQKNHTNLKISCKYFNSAKILEIAKNNFHKHRAFQVVLFDKTDADIDTLNIAQNYWGKLTPPELEAATWDVRRDKTLKARVVYASEINRISARARRLSLQASVEKID